MILQPTIAGKKLPALTNPGSAADLLAGKQLIDADGNVLTGTMPTQGAQTITPGTAVKTIAAGRYLTGTQTIQGDADLKAENIKSGVNIFGVTGTLVSKNLNINTMNGSGTSELQIKNVATQPILTVVYTAYTGTGYILEVVVCKNTAGTTLFSSVSRQESTNTYSFRGGVGGFSYDQSTKILTVSGNYGTGGYVFNESFMYFVAHI